MKHRQGRSLDVLAELRQQAGYGGGPPGDPHVWLDPVRYAAMVRLIGTALGDGGARRPASPAGSTRSTASTGAASPTARAARS